MRALGISTTNPLSGWTATMASPSPSASTVAQQSGQEPADARFVLARIDANHAIAEVEEAAELRAQVVELRARLAQNE